MPVEPIQLTLSGEGKCMLFVLFKPIRRVSIATAGNLVISSLMSLLRMIAGKGYLFCPGISEKFLIGKPVGRFVILHCIPFKRYQAKGCPVYFRMATPSTPSRNSIKSPCPRCMQVIRLSQRFSAASNSVPTPPPSLSNHKPVLDSITSEALISSGDHAPLVITSTAASTPTPTPKDSKPFSTLVAMQPTSVPTIETQTVIPANMNSKDLREQREPNKSPEAVGNSHTLQSSEQLEVISKSLRQLLVEMSNERIHAARMAQDNSTTTSDRPGDARNSPSNSKNNSKIHICRVCRKRFSTHDSLRNHLERHRGSIHSIKRSSKAQKKSKDSSSASSSLLKSIPMLLSRRGSLNGKQKTIVPESSIRLLVKYIDSALNGEVLKTPKTVSRKRLRPSDEENLQKMCAVPEVQPPAPVTNRLPEMRKESKQATRVGLFSLLKAAEIAGERSESDSSFARSTEMNESHNPAKKTRKSSRIAFKKQKAAAAASVVATPPVITVSLSQVQQPPPVQKASVDDALSNLDLLSTVSLEKASFESGSASSVASLVSNSSTITIPQSNPRSTSDSPASETFSTSNCSIYDFPSLRPKLRESKSTGAPVAAELRPIPPLILAESVLPPTASAGSSLLLTSIPNSLPSSDSVASRGPVVLALNRVVTANLNKAAAIAASSIPMPSVSDSEGSPLPSLECEAMDLTKPKSILPLGDPMEKIASASPVGMISLAALKGCLNKRRAGDHTVLAPAGPSLSLRVVNPKMSSLISNKEADDELQKRMFNSARKYKLNLDQATVRQVQQHMMAHTNAHLANIAAIAPRGSEKSTCLSNSEIQCGYKWSGSGGLVKERTQLVRELVPSAVMDNILSKSTTEEAASSSKTTTPPRPVTRMVVSESSEKAAVVPSSKPVSPRILNLSVAKEAEAPKAPVTHIPQPPNQNKQKTSAPGTTLTLFPAGFDANQSNILRTSLLKPPSTVRDIIKTGRVHQNGSAGGNEDNASWQQQQQQQQPQQKAMNLSQTAAAKPVTTSTSSVSSSSSPSGTKTAGNNISSPSLAAILRQPVKQSESGSEPTAALRSSISTLNGTSVPNTTQSLLNNIKTEPQDGSPTTNSDLELPVVKIEQSDALVEIKDIRNVKSNSSEGSPSQGVKDVEPVAAASNKSNNVSHVVSKLPRDIRSLTLTLKCEKCHQVFTSQQASTGHSCLK